MREKARLVFARSLTLLLVVSVLMGVDSLQSDKNNVDMAATLQGAVNRKWDLKPRYTPGQKRYYRIWQTIENLDQGGAVQSRNQWRGDYERVVKSVESNGKAVEQVTWKNVGLRNWNSASGRYDQAIPLPWASGFSYLFSAEDDYTDLERVDYSAVPKNMLGFGFRGALQVTAHVEFDYLRSSRHARIERLQHPGQILRDIPEEGVVFSLELPPVVTNSKLERKHVQLGFVGLTVLNGEPCAILDYRQGPQNFSWQFATGQAPDGTPTGVTQAGLKSWHYGVFYVRLDDGSLVQSELVESHVHRNRFGAGTNAGPAYSRGTWTVREIRKEEFDRGLTDWGLEQTPGPEMQLPRPVGATDSSALAQAFSGQFDLRARPQPGSSSFYRLTSTLYRHDNLGNVGLRSQWRGHFERRADSSPGTGKSEETITWKDVGFRRAQGGQEVPYEPHSAPDWAQGFSYPFSPELSYEDFPWSRYADIPRTLLGYEFKLHTVNAHFEFDFLRSSLHGAIEKIRRIGDQVRVPDNGRAFSIDHAPLIVNSQIRRENVVTTFLGFSQVHGEPCAVFEFRQGPQRFSWDRITDQHKTEHTELTSRQYGLLCVSLTDGSLLRGDFAERGILRTRGPGGEEQPGNFVAVFELEKITPEQSRRGLRGWDKEQPKHPVGRVYDR